MCRGRRARILLHLHIQRKRESCEGAELVGVLVAETIHPACMCEGGGPGGREAGAPSDLKMPLENGRADERVNRGQTNEILLCVCVTVSVEKGHPTRPLAGVSTAV